MKNLSRLTALLVACMLLFTSLAYAADVGVPVSELDADTYNQMVTNAASSDSNVVIGIGMVNADGVSMNSKWWTAGYTESESLAVLAERTLVDVYEGTYGLPYGILTGEWYKVSYNGQIGYIETKYLDVLEDAVADESGVIVQGMPEGAELVVQTLASDVFGGGFVADISLENWNGEAVTLTLPVSGYADGSSIDVLHFLEDESKISAATPVMNVDSLGSLREALADAMTACKAATGKENCVAVDLSSATVQNGAVTVDVDSFSVFAAEEIVTYTYEFYVDDVKQSTQILVADSNGKALLLEPAKPEKTDHVFEGWLIEDAAEDTDYLTFGEMEITSTEDQTFKYNAQFRTAYNVYFMYNVPTEDEPNPTVLLVDDDVPKDAVVYTSIAQYPSNGDYAVVSWHLKQDLSDDPVESVTVKDSSITLWPNVQRVYWINYNVQGGSFIDPVFYTENEVPTDPGKDASTKIGYKLAGWTLDEEGEDDYAFEAPLTQNTTLYAKWEPATSHYTIMAVMQQAEDGTLYDPIEGLSWTIVDATTDGPVDLNQIPAPEGTDEAEWSEKTWIEKINTHVDAYKQNKSNKDADFVVYNEWFKLNEAKTDEAAISQSVASDGSTIVKVYFDRKLIEIQFYGRETHNNSDASNGYVNSYKGTTVNKFTTDGLSWVEVSDEEDADYNPVLFSLKGRYGESIKKENTYKDGEQSEEAWDTYNNTTKYSWMFRGLTANGRTWPFDLTKFTTFPTHYAIKDANGNEPYLTYKVFSGTASGVGNEWQMFYFVQALANEEGVGVANVGLPYKTGDSGNYEANWDTLDFEDSIYNDDNSTNNQPDSLSLIDGWDYKSEWTSTWKDEEKNIAGTVFYTPYDGFTLGAYAFDILKEGDDVATRCDHSFETSNMWEVGTLKGESTGSIWTRIHKATDDSFVNLDDELDSGEWKYWMADTNEGDNSTANKFVSTQLDKPAFFTDGYGISYVRNRGDIYVRLLRNDYTLTFMGQNEEGDSYEIDSVNLYYEETLNVDTRDNHKKTDISSIINNATAPTGYVLDGWYTGLNGTGERVNFGDVSGSSENMISSMPARNLTVYANYKKEVYTVTVYTNLENTTYKTYSVSYGETVPELSTNLVPDFDESKHKFYGWYKKDSTTDLLVPFNFDQQIHAPIELYPRYGEEDPYTVTYNQNVPMESGEETTWIDPYAYFAGSGAIIVGVADTEFANGDKVFLGWNTQADGNGTTYLPGEYMETMQSEVLYAIWGDAPGMVTLTYHENFGNSTKKYEVQMQVNSTHTILDVTDAKMNYSHLGYMFVGWNTKPDGRGTTHQPEAEIVVTQDETNGTNDLYAIWQPLYGSLTITKEADVSLDPNQSFIFEVEQTDNTTTEKLDSPIKVVINGSGSVTIEHLPLGTYSVKELTDWSWRYDVEDDDTKTTSIVASEAVSDGQMTIVDGEVKFKNDRTHPYWLDGENWTENHFDAESTNKTSSGSN